MNWKKKLQDLEQARAWNEAIVFMEKFIQEHPDNMEAYLFINYLLANLITEEQDWELHNEDTWNHVVDLLKKYLDESYEKFSDNSEYLFYTAKICGYVDWYLGDENKDYIAMFKKAIALEPDNIFYKQIYLQHLSNSIPLTEESYVEFAKRVVAHEPEIEKIFAEKGALGESVRSSLEYSSRKILGLPYASF